MLSSHYLTLIQHGFYKKNVGTFQDTARTIRKAKTVAAKTFPKPKAEL